MVVEFGHVKTTNHEGVVVRRLLILRVERSTDYLRPPKLVSVYLDPNKFILLRVIEPTNSLNELLIFLLICWIILKVTNQLAQQARSKSKPLLLTWLLLKLWAEDLTVKNIGFDNSLVYHPANPLRPQTSNWILSCFNSSSLTHLHCWFQILITRFLIIPPPKILYSLLLFLTFIDNTKSFLVRTDLYDLLGSFLTVILEFCEVSTLHFIFYIFDWAVLPHHH